jgi:hypothetical protein
MKNGKNSESKEIMEYHELQRCDILDWLGVIECVHRSGFLLLLWQKEEFFSGIWLESPKERQMVNQFDFLWCDQKGKGVSEVE